MSCVGLTVAPVAVLVQQAQRAVLLLAVPLMP
jgi:hypothetical protein